MTKIAESLDSELSEELFLWRLILEGICSLEELKTSWTLDDVLRATAILDMKQAIQKMAEARMEKGKKF